jgi:phosphatidylcholine synthase
VFGVWAIFAIFAHEYRLAIYLMMLTMVIDSTDGMMARFFDVKGRIPWFDGRRLDDMCDFFTYVLVPACMMVEAELLPHPAWAAVPVLASAYQFSQDDAKTDDHFFVGFPSYWNIVAMYTYLMGAAPTTALLIVLICSFGVFVPIKYLYPTRTRYLRPLSLGMMGAWALVFSWTAVRPDPSSAWLWASLFGPVYYVGLSFFLNVYRPRP